MFAQLNQASISIFQLLYVSQQALSLSHTQNTSTIAHCLIQLHSLHNRNEVTKSLPGGGGEGGERRTITQREGFTHQTPNFRRR